MTSPGPGLFVYSTSSLSSRQIQTREVVGPVDSYTPTSKSKPDLSRLWESMFIFVCGFGGHKLTTILFFIVLWRCAYVYFLLVVPLS